MSSLFINLDIFRDPLFNLLTPSQRLAIPHLVALMQSHGENDALDWSREEIYRAISLGEKAYTELLSRFLCYGWGFEREDGALVLLGPLSCKEALLDASGPGFKARVSKLVEEALKAQMPQVLAIAIPQILDQYNAHREADEEGDGPAGTAELAEAEANANG